jgi:hypothetical protein
LEEHNKKKRKTLKNNNFNINQILNNNENNNINNNNNNDKMILATYNQSVNSSEAGYARSIDKYNYYEDFISSPTQPAALILLKALEVIKFVVYIAAAIVTLLTIYSSFDKLVRNIDMLGLSSDIMSPFGNFFNLAHVYNSLLEFYTSNSTWPKNFEKIYGDRMLK